MVHFDHGVAVLPPVAIAVPILGAAVVLVGSKRLSRLVVDAVTMTVTAATVGTLAVVLSASTSGRVVTWAAGWTPVKGYSVGIVLVADPVGAGIAVVAASLTFLSLFYSARYIDSAGGHYHCLVLLFLAGMVGLSLTGDVFDMFCFFELMGAAAYGLTGMKVEDESALQGALNFGLVNSLGAYFSLSGVGILLAHTGTLSLPILGRDLSHQRPDALIVAAFCLVLTGFLVKGAMVPFHFWLADAHAVAPAPVCALFSGVMVPLGIYSVFRIYWTVFAGAIALGDARRAFIVLGALTALTGAVMCVSQRHVKRLLAFSTIAHVGLFLIALGCLTQAGTAGAIVYVVGHSGVKAALFLLAGILLDLYGTIDEHALYGRARRHRVLGGLFVVAGLALAGLPPFGTALGKAIAEQAGMAQGYPWIPVVFVAVSAVTGAAVLRVAGRAFFAVGPRPRAAGRDGQAAAEGTEEPDAPLRRVPWSMVAPVLVLLAGALAAGVLPGARTAADRAAAYFIDRGGYISQALFHADVRTGALATANWTGLGYGLDAVSVLLAVGIAAAALYGPTLLDTVPHARTLRAAVVRPIGVLHRLHSGHVGDYVAWMMLGIAVVAALVGLPLR